MLLDCPTVIMHDAAATGLHYSPHEPFQQIGPAGWGQPYVPHYRNYGWTDGHVAGVVGLQGY